MADKSKGTSKKKAAPAKKPVPIKKASKPATKSVKKPAPKTAKPVTPVKVQDKQAVSDAGKAFDKKIDQMAQKTATVLKQEEKPKSGFKAIIAIIVIIILGVIAYLFYPREKVSVVKEQTVPKEPAIPKPEEKIAEPQKDAAKPKSDDVIVYKVKYKDQLTEISKQYYGNHKEWKRIYEANKDKIKNPHLIFPGQEFIIPKIKK